MSFLDAGQDYAPSPTTGQPIPRITVTPRGAKAPKVEPTGDPFDALPAWRPTGAGGATTGAAVQAGGEHPFDALPEWKPSPAKPPPREVGTVAALGTGMLSGITFGGAPALAGLSEAGGTARSGEEIRADPQGMTLADAASPFVGAAKMLRDLVGGTNDPAVHDAYERGRQAALENQQLAQEQHPHAFLAGQMAASLATPTFGAAIPGTLATRAIRGAGAGAIGGGLTGAGGALSEGAPLPEVARRGAVSAAIGAPIGGTLGAAIGPRVAGALTPGQRAAATAESLGAPLPRGVTSDYRPVQATTAKLQELPFVGERIGGRVQETQRAAGQRVEDIASTAAGGATDRASVGASMRPALQGVIDANNVKIDRAYDSLRGLINPDQLVGSLPRTRATLQKVVDQRLAAGHSNPLAGLEQIDNLSAHGATFNGLQRARHDVGNMIDFARANPGIDAGDLKRLYGAMTGDMADVARAARKSGAASADVTSAFANANKTAATHIEQNANIQNLLGMRADEGIVAKLLGSAKNLGGNIRLLAQLRSSLPSKDFEQIGGVLLNELGRNNATGEFSLAQFVTGWNKVSGRAKGMLFSPQHLKDIEDIVGMGAHIKGSLSAQSRGQSGGLLVMLDVAKDAALLSADIATTGLPGGLTALGAGSTAALYTLTHWLGNPAKARAMATFSKAYGGLSAYPAPARIAAFNVATRNLAHNLDVPVESIIKFAKMRAEGGADDQR